MGLLINAEARIDHGRVSPTATANSPHKLECDDGEIYVVKPTLPDRQFANELIAFAIANLLQLPVFDAALVTITPALISVSRALATARYAPGVHFGSKMPKAPHFNFLSVSPALVTSNFRNKDDFYKLVLFDDLVLNVDRERNAGNLVAVEISNGTPQSLDFFAIDHGYALGGPGWTAAILDAQPLVALAPVLGVVRDVITSRNKLVGEAHVAAQLTPRFQQAVEEARTGLGQGDIDAVVRLLAQRAPALPAWAGGPPYATKLPMMV